MHMADALVSPAVGGTMWAVSAGLIGYCSAQTKKKLDERIIPLMGVLGAFVFAAQMINFTIPATGSSGHLGGGLLLAVLLGPWAAFLTLCSILTIQALFFADGGIIALGCNIFNLGFFPCLVAYPLIYKPIAEMVPTRMRIFTGAVVAAVAALQFGAFGVVVQTTLSGITELPLLTFALFMQPIHLAIGIVEGLATASIVLFLSTARPDLVHFAHDDRSAPPAAPFPALKILAFAALITGGVFSWYASTNPDGLEWAVMQTAGTEEVGSRQHALLDSAARLQNRAAFLPEYGFRADGQGEPEAAASLAGLDKARIGTTVSGLLGSGLFLLFTTILILLFRVRRVKN